MLDSWFSGEVSTNRYEPPECVLETRPFNVQELQELLAS